ncbi:TetR/AcrR family transcriptional regulator [Chitinophagaceae bacterium MMS25-I14]
MEKETSRKQKIADIALQLFAERGYDTTSTQLIAKEAGVSEALIFKHYGNKEHLLAYVIKTGYMRVVEQNRGMLREQNPHELIMKVLDLPYKLITEEPYFWKMQYRLLDMELSMKSHQHFMQPVNTLLHKAFADLGYAQPEQETEFVLLLIDALWKNHVWKGATGMQEMIRFIKNKYTSRVTA